MASSEILTAGTGSLSQGAELKNRISAVCELTQVIHWKDPNQISPFLSCTWWRRAGANAKIQRLKLWPVPHTEISFVFRRLGIQHTSQGDYSCDSFIVFLELTDPSALSLYYEKDFLQKIHLLCSTEEMVMQLGSNMRINNSRFFRAFSFSPSPLHIKQCCTCLHVSSCCAHQDRIVSPTTFLSILHCPVQWKERPITKAAFVFMPLFFTNTSMAML